MSSRCLVRVSHLILSSTRSVGLNRNGGTYLPSEVRAAPSEEPHPFLSTREPFQTFLLLLSLTFSSRTQLSAVHDPHPHSFSLVSTRWYTHHFFHPRSILDSIHLQTSASLLDLSTSFHLPVSSCGAARTRRHHEYRQLGRRSASGED